jgi:outer membrane protein assembly factor BamA
VIGAALCWLALIVAGGAQGSTPPRLQGSETLAEIRVHGNHVTPDDEIIALSQLKLGMTVTDTTITDVTERLRASKKFDDVSVLKRFASIADPTQVVIVIIVNEGPVRLDIPNVPGAAPRILKRRGFHNLMFMPILNAEDGYGFTYGVRLALLGPIGPRSRLSFPLSWGGLKQAGVELDRVSLRGPFTRVAVGGNVQRQRNPAFLLNDDRQRVWGRVERAIGPLRAGGIVGWQRVTFASAIDKIRSVGADVAIDTRVDPVLPRNAVYAIASVERLGFDSGGTNVRTRIDANAYLGVYRQTVLELRAVREDASQPLPLYLKSLLGGWSSLRGFKAGSFVGDTMVHTTAELRIPLSSPLDVGKLGVSVFIDAGKAYDKGFHFGDLPMHQGAGGSVWVTATVLRMSVSVAHGRGVGTRANFGVELSF